MGKPTAIAEMARSLYSDLTGGNLDDESTEIKFHWIQIATEKYNNILSGF